ncbi:MAG: hypothetical protein E7049_13095 [Lentisphaerae bacterium]|nr:hypothetical protein [Lentisphaerota bacterium]
MSVDVALEHFLYLFMLSVDAFLQQPIFLGLLLQIRLCTPNYGRSSSVVDVVGILAINSLSAGQGFGHVDVA